jgi:hypothetical protein
MIQIMNKGAVACYSQPMRWFIFMIIVFAVLWYIRGIEDVKPPPIEEGIIGGPIRALHKAEGFEESYLDATEQRQKQMEEQLEKDSGGG